ncbi:MAG: PaaI family thioesterase [Flavobacteriales bacterium]|nr:PaaI family thioesterase [Flavobacteriales bacterium]
MNFNAQIDDYQDRVFKSFAKQKFMSYIGAEMISVKPGYCEIEINSNPNLTQQHGYFHAGVISTIADNCCGYAGLSLMDQKSSILTVEFKINLIAPGEGDKLIGKGTVIKAGRTLTIAKAEVFSIVNGKSQPCAICQATLIELKNHFN